MTRPSKIHIVQTPPLAVDRTTAAAALGVSESTLEGLVRSGDLPPPRRISANRVGWLWRELQAWVESRPVSDLAPGPGRTASRDETTAA
jgi:prophage regulatory protein